MIPVLQQGYKTAMITKVPYKGCLALVVKGLSRLPVTEEIAGSNPVERATEKYLLARVGIFLLSTLLFASHAVAVQQRSNQLHATTLQYSHLSCSYNRDSKHAPTHRAPVVAHQDHA